MADLQVYLDRVVAIANDLDEIALASDEYPDEVNVKLIDSLPFAFVDDGGATYVSKNSNLFEVTREIISLIYVARFTKTSVIEENAARKIARTLLPIYARQFMTRHRLQLDGSNFDVVATIKEDSGIETASRHNSVYTCLYFRHSIVYKEDVREV